MTGRTGGVIIGYSAAIWWSAALQGLDPMVAQVAFSCFGFYGIYGV